MLLVILDLLIAHRCYPRLYANVLGGARCYQVAKECLRAPEDGFDRHRQGCCTGGGGGGRDADIDG